MSDENRLSSYLRYLPPVLWEGEAPLLGRLLLIFEKLLTGIDDEQVIQHGDHTHQSLEEAIARLDQLLDPWHTPPQLLDWLASWVDLTFPTIWDPGQHSHIQIWDEYLRRRAISQIVQIYSKRGLKEGLSQYLDLYTLADKRPRIAVDNGSRILFTRPQSGRFAPISTLIGQGPYANNTNVALDGLVAPRGILLAPDNSLLVVDSGTPLGWNPATGKGIWRVLPSGQYTQSTTTGKPQRLGPSTFTLTDPVAIAIDNATPWQLYVLDNVSAAGANALYQLASPNFATANVLATRSALGFGYPVAMALDTNGHLLILDRGNSPGTTATPRLIDIQINPLQVSTPHTFTQVVEPLSLTVLPNGDLLIGDGRQNAAVPADIVHVNRSNNTSWVETLQFTAVPPGQNPLIAPVSMVRLDDTHLFVLDLGLKPVFSSGSQPFIRTMAETASIYTIDLGSTPPTITRATEQRQLVHPTGMVQDQWETLYIADRGEYSDPQLAGQMLRVWRAAPHEFGVSVHFSQQRPTTQQEQRQIYQNIADIVDQEKPAHTIWTMVYGPP
ncbi:phage tail protein [Dictyobacter formicarum]|uniref:Phage tail protein n=1 Tax=Dictyobacter formicarum TaxID=2778368 RepID=A0ABQ3VBL8_9CHLR|nr:phage tail protein [Dictyobacter formicarum]GHO83203.1 hypothetical protein KSZ_12090 [Dictyobacter formicarum]